ncbi:hypothetical protein Thimo_0786 [Thioflavicoccus mobilis 8321]|uniref:eCIS core domain-containing protein n=1 Tax=Thioflavicoccus mobilis 8321 TaxID=765912 RepID=L0GW70_9GAMM|nr:DUF4157 domain-containing protein [Thioflavicoccus mobilis]AGA89625.1 hypothetical protein Thimo_0786 [Thioflavicoccus mobilis 8321]
MSTCHEALRRPGPGSNAAPREDAHRDLRLGPRDAPAERAADAAVGQLARSGRAPSLAPAARLGGDRRKAGSVPASVRETLARPGTPLPDATRAFFEPRFGHDFARVRVHADAAAARSAADVAAQAYAVGPHIVFGSGRFSPETGRGRGLIGHELAHVVQAGDGGRVLRRYGLGEAIAGLFAGDDFDEQTLQDYLNWLRREHRIEDHTDSDNKARAIVNAWRRGTSPYVLTQELKALLIEEMLSGATGNDDERAILELLERSYNFELAYIFGAGGITADRLNGAFQGDEQNCLDDFFQRRFRGGEAALLQGQVAPQGLPVAFGDQAPSHCAARVRYSGLDVDWSVPCVLGILCSEDRDVIEALPGFAVQRVSGIEVDFWEYANGAWGVRDTRHPAGAADADATPPAIWIDDSRGCASTVRTIVHEVRHQHQPAGTRFAREQDAYTFTEQWAIDRGLPGYSNRFRTTDPQTGATSIDQQAVDAYVRQRYPGTATQGETIVGHRDSDGHTQISPASGADYYRAPQPGDSHWGEPNFLAPQPIPASDWACPSGSPPLQSLPPGLLRQDFNDRLLRSVEDLP